MKKLFVVFEGVDGSGKTSLAKQIAKNNNVNYTHNDKSRSYEEGKANSFNYIKTLEKMKTGVIDRLVHTGETVYAPLYRGYDGIDYFEELENEMIDKFNIVIVYVYANDDVIIDRLNKRGEDYIDINHIKALKDNYANYLSKTKIPFIAFNNSEGSIEKNAIKLQLDLAVKINKEFNK